MPDSALRLKLDRIRNNELKSPSFCLMGAGGTGVPAHFLGKSL